MNDLKDNSTNNDGSSSRPSGRPQFGISAMMWTTLVIALAFGYLRQINSPAVFGSAVAVFAAAIVVGGLVGWWTKRIGDATYWSVIVAMAAFLSVAGDLAVTNNYRFAWSAVGVLAGAACGAVAPKKLGRRMLFAAIAGITGMAAFSFALPVHDLEWIFDLVCAPIIGALVAVLVEMILWLERQSHSPRYITASWLLLAVIAGNMLVPVVLSV